MSKVELAIKISEIVNSCCIDVLHNIGLEILNEIDFESIIGKISEEAYVEGFNEGFNDGVMAASSEILNRI